MGMRFRKSIKIVPGVKINVGKKSAGISVGNKYGGVSINSKTGIRSRTSIPGTGISFTENSSRRVGKVQSTEKTLHVEPYSTAFDEKVIYSLNDAAFNDYMLGYIAYAKTISADDPRIEETEKQIAILQKEQIRRFNAEKEKERKRNEPSLLLVICGLVLGACGILTMISSLWGLAFVVLGIVMLLAEYSKK